ncbi:MAG: aromatic amino acid lyase [Pseudomonadota bacterium]
MQDAVILGDAPLLPASVEAIASGAPVSIAPAGLDRMARSRAHLLAAQSADRPIYGVTTGLGPRVVERLSPEEQQAMSIKTIRGRAHSVGEPLPRSVVRAAMALRAHTLLSGGSGADPSLAETLAAWLNAGLSPVVPSTGSVGAADLMWGGNLGLGLIGEGDVDTGTGRGPAGPALEAAGIRPYRPGSREGLAMVSHSSFAAALAALGVARCRRWFAWVQSAAALSMEGFRANITPFLTEVLALRPQPGQAAAAAGILECLEGSALMDPASARRLQDPLSFRNAAQVHGALLAAMEWSEAAATDEVNGASDNPVVIPDTGAVMSSGGFLTPMLTVSLGALNQALVHVAAMQTARIARLLTPRFTDLPVGLAAADTGSAGIAPATKTAEALCAEITLLAAPALVYPGGGADGVEDVISHSALPAKALREILDRMFCLSALELIVAVQAVELRAAPQTPPRLVDAIRQVRAVVPRVTEDRALGADIERLAARMDEAPR